MNVLKLIDNLQMRGKFNLLLAIQVVVLVLVGGVGWAIVADLQQGQGNLSLQLRKTATTSRILNGMNLARTLHISLIGGAADPDYLTAREAKLKEYSDTLEKDLKVLHGLSWTAEEKPVLDEAIEAFRKYDSGFPALL